MFGLKTFCQKNAFGPLTQKLLAKMPSHTSSLVLAVFLIVCSSPFNVKRDGSNSISLHTSDKSVAVISLTFLCCKVTNLPFLHDMPCLTLNLSPPEQLTGKPGMDQPYRNLMESRNCRLFNTVQFAHRYHA